MAEEGDEVGSGYDQEGPALTKRAKRKADQLEAEHQSDSDVGEENTDAKQLGLKLEVESSSEDGSDTKAESDNPKPEGADAIDGWYRRHKLRATDTKTFHQFGLLPVEIQCHVWCLSAGNDDLWFPTAADYSRLLVNPETRIATTFHNELNEELRYAEIGHVLEFFVDAVGVELKAILVTCRLARQMTLEVLKKRILFEAAQVEERLRLDSYDKDDPSRSVLRDITATFDNLIDDITKSRN